jgi:pimeloyl-ACP methyl ester carboxylesterase/predicted DCC family thiol-disulfide oxidoreductase YuxK
MNPGTPVHLDIQPVPFQARDGRTIGAAERGTLTVPMNRARPDGARVELAFVRLPCTEFGPGTPVVFLTGGPGLSAIQAGTGRLFDWFDRLRAAGDVILLDQRGCGDSRPSPGGLEAPPLPSDRALSRGEFTRETVAAMRRRAEQLARDGIDLAAFNTNESADDVADLVRALYGAATEEAASMGGAEPADPGAASAGGIEPGAPRRLDAGGGGSMTGPARANAVKVALLGWSYGTHLAMAVLRRHESLVARAVLAGPEGPDHTYKLPSRIQRHLEDLAARLRDDPRWRPYLPDLVGTLRGVLERLDREPARAGDLVVTRLDLEWMIAGGLADPRFLRRLPRWVLRMARGDFSDVARDSLLRDAYNELRAGAGTPPLRACVDCASGATAARLERIEREARETLLGRTIDFPFPDICDAVGNPDPGDEFRGPLRVQVPVMFVTGTLDCRTPADNVADLAPGFAHHVHVVAEDTGHGDLLLPRAVQRTITAFLTRGAVEARRVRADEPFEFARPRGTLLYDGACAFCRARVERMKRRAGDGVEFVPYQEAGARFPDLRAEDLARAVHFVGPEGRVTRGAGAVFEALAMSDGRHPYLWMYHHLPGFRHIAEWGYRLVARHRGRLPH